MGWSSNGKGMQLRIGIGTNPNNSSVARFHIYLPGTSVSQAFANDALKLKIHLANKVGTYTYRGLGSIP
jgi:hypothetical protein